MSVFKRGEKYWVGFRFNHRRYRMSSPVNSLTGARAHEALLRQKLARGESIVPEKEEKKEFGTFKEFSEEWFEIYVKTNNKHTEIVNKRSILNVHLIPFFGTKALNEINGLNVEGFKAKEIKASLANKTINNSLTVLSRCLKTAQEWGLLENIPRIKLLKVQQQKFDFLTEDEAWLLLNNSDGLLNDMILVALRTGLRFGELIALEWSDIDFNQNILTVSKAISKGVLGSTKSNKIRYVPLLDEVREALLTRFNKKAKYVFYESYNTSLVYMTCLRWLVGACKRAGLRKIGWHTLRHTFASHLAQRGVSITIVKELLGHSDIRTTMRYSHMSNLAMKEAIMMLNKNIIGHNMATISNLAPSKIVDIIPAEMKILPKSQ